MGLYRIIIVAAAVSLSIACAKDGASPEPKAGEPAAPSTKEAEAIAKEAYIYAYPMMESYRTMYVQAVDRTAQGYKAPFNQLVHSSALLGPEFKDVVRPNNDTLYSFAWLDLRAEPVVVTVPKIEGRYYSVQLIDMYTHNFAYLGTRATHGEAGSYAVAGPGPEWDGATPDGAKDVLVSESQFVYCIVRIEVRGPEDVAAVKELQKGFRLTPLHVFLGRTGAPAASGITFPAHDATKAKSAGFMDLLGFLLSQVEPNPDEAELMQRFARVGIRPGATAASLGLDPPTRQAVDAGVGAALVAISRAASDPSTIPGITVRSDKGWSGVDGLFGSRETMGSRYLARAVAAMIGLYGNDTAEAYYPIGLADATGDPLDGSAKDYTMRFEKSQLPQVDAFWSMTIYSLPDQLMVENPIGRYSIGDRSKLEYGKDGSLTIYIQHDSPGERHQSNWLPAPDGPFSLQFRMYLPKPAALHPLYLPPPIVPRQ